MSSFPDSYLPRLGIEPNPNVFERPNVAVFVHGIHSDSNTFTPLVTALRKIPAFQHWSLDRFDYDFQQNIPISADQLARKLEDEYAFRRKDVTLVCHSMGGLVARLALLRKGDRLPFVKRVIMLGTPNHGTLHTARFGLLFQLLRGSIDGISALFPRKRGVLELTEISRVMGENLDTDSVERTRAVEYVTIPALFFHEDRGDIESIFDGGGGLSLMNMAVKVAQAYPYWEVGLEIPHDGIVEEDSVRLRPSVTTRASEMTCFSAEEAAQRSIHVRHRDYQEVNHVQIQSAACTVELIRELLLCSSVADWWATKVGNPDFIRD